MRLCVSGGAGFIGSSFVRIALADASRSVTVLDSLTYAGNLENLEGLDGTGRLTFIKGDIADPAKAREAAEGCDAIINFAAESHVDRSISDPDIFIATNVRGARVLMEVAVEKRVRFVQVSTDEVYGSLGAEGLFSEQSPLAPSSPYAASKAAADLMLGAYATTYGLDAVITRCGNNYGPRQFPEKLIPLFITNAMADQSLPLYGDGLNVRDWIHVDDHSRAIMTALEKGESGRVYNVSAQQELSNRDVCDRILAALGKPDSMVRYIEDRPGHDRRYALDAARISAELGWSPLVDFDEGLGETIKWYVDNQPWWQRVKSGEYRNYYENVYGDRLKSSRSGPGE
ncbi:MAG: dTDP-glucose 4,6-dehydratase [Deltaproteobacteria bacterium]